MDLQFQRLAKKALSKNRRIFHDVHNGELVGSKQPEGIKNLLVAFFISAPISETNSLYR